MSWRRGSTPFPVTHGRARKESRTVHFGPRRGLVYFALRPGGCIKIGKSDKPEERVGALGRAAAAPMLLLATEPGGLRREHELHERFAHLRVDGEWFRPAADLLAYISGLDGASSS